jgi:hypothetical protein
MPLPGGVETVTVTDGGVPLVTPDGTLMNGYLTFVAPDLATVAADDLIFGGYARRQVVDGRFDPITLVATDATGLSPAFSYTIRATMRRGAGANWTRYASLPKAVPSVVLADVLVTDPSPVGSLYIAAVPAATVVTETTAGQVSAVGTSTAYARADHTHGTPAAGGGGGGGSSIRTVTVRVTDDNLSGLPSAAAWTAVQTSGGTVLKASIAASAGDRVRLCPNFMYNGAHFLDWAVLDSAGSPAVYATSGTSTPSGEGDPAMYPSTSFSRYTTGEMFTVASGNIDGSGEASFALMHQGTSPGTVYAHTLYPFRLRLENIGPEPS